MSIHNIVSTFLEQFRIATSADAFVHYVNNPTVIKLTNVARILNYQKTAFFQLLVICLPSNTIGYFIYKGSKYRCHRIMDNLQTLFKEHCIVPDVLNTAPSELLDIKYSSGIRVETGKELTPTQVKDTPVVKWTAKDSEYYTLAMVDPDAPSRENPKFREWHHWLLGNIYGGDMKKAEVLSDYIGSGPPKGTGLHRYVFLIYKQPEKCDFSKVPKLPNNSGDKRGKFSISKFAQQFKLGAPIAGNFYLAKYDDYVPKLYAKLKG